MSELTKYTTVEMDEKKSDESNNDLEEPFNEEFWQKVGIFDIVLDKWIIRFEETALLKFSRFVQCPLSFE